MKKIIVFLFLIVLFSCSKEEQKPNVCYECTEMTYWIIPYSNPDFQVWKFHNEPFWRNSTSILDSLYQEYEICNIDDINVHIEENKGIEKDILWETVSTWRIWKTECVIK